MPVNNATERELSFELKEFATAKFKPLVEKCESPAISFKKVAPNEISLYNFFTIKESDNVLNGTVTLDHCDLLCK